jgi:hypothetical protein
MNSSGKDANCFFLTVQGQQLKLLLTVYLIILELLTKEKELLDVVNVFFVQ